MQFSFGTFWWERFTKDQLLCSEGGHYYYWHPVTNLPPMTSLIFLRKLRCWTLYNTQFKLTAKPAIVYFDKKKKHKENRGYIHIIFQCEHIGHVCRYLYTVLNFVFSRKKLLIEVFLNIFLKHLKEENNFLFEKINHI